MIDFNAKSDFIQSLMIRLTFPEDAIVDIQNALCNIRGEESAQRQFSRILQEYDSADGCNYQQMLSDAVELGNPLGIHGYTVSLLLFLCMAEELKHRYAMKGICESVYFNTLMDLRYKLEECRLVYGVNGSFVASWFGGFFDMTRFALGRLQFELTTIPDDYTVGGIAIPQGSKAIAMHIPRTGNRLNHDEVLESYRMAADFFEKEFENQPIVFNCDSWLLDPWNITVLAPSSNLAAFFNDFKIVYTQNYGNYDQMWRLFDCLCNGNLADLPRDSSLRRAYALRMERGEPIGWGRGLFVYRRGEIINKP